MSIAAVLSSLKAEQQQLEGQLKQLNAAIASLGGLSKNSHKGRKGTMSAAGRARVAAAQRARWAKIKAKKK